MLLVNQLSPPLLKIKSVLFPAGQSVVFTAFKIALAKSVLFTSGQSVVSPAVKIVDTKIPTIYLGLVFMWHISGLEIITRLPVRGDNGGVFHEAIMAESG